ncbi:hypothetical protein ACFZB9_07710 [Kitasatospora sp. NPDC008050]|uniref:hypothetical protein n=1 Tax=Kitasatospora sp. NPDC008050 TaxID=3364021 RepID=UPI0036EDF143
MGTLSPRPSRPEPARSDLLLLATTATAGLALGALAGSLLRDQRHRVHLRRARQVLAEAPPIAPTPSPHRPATPVPGRPDPEPRWP